MTVKDFKAELKSGNIGNLYVFYGEEGYLREYYLGELQKLVVGDMMPEFNVTVINRAPEFSELSDAVESYPAMNDRRIIIVRNFDVISANADFSEKAEKLFSDMPEHSVLVFVYSNPEVKFDKRRKLYKVIEKHGKFVNFETASKTDLLSWVARRFMAVGKEIRSETADYLLFYSGERMELLIPEIEKIGAYAKKKEITKEDIEAVASKNLTSVVFDVVNAIAEKKYDRNSRARGSERRADTYACSHCTSVPKNVCSKAYYRKRRRQARDYGVFRDAERLSCEKPYVCGKRNEKVRYIGMYKALYNGGRPSQVRRRLGRNFAACGAHCGR